MYLLLRLGVLSVLLVVCGANLKCWTGAAGHEKEQPCKTGTAVAKKCVTLKDEEAVPMWYGCDNDLKKPCGGDDNKCVADAEADDKTKCGAAKTCTLCCCTGDNCNKPIKCWQGKTGSVKSGQPCEGQCANFTKTAGGETEYGCDGFKGNKCKTPDQCEGKITKPPQLCCCGKKPNCNYEEPATTTTEESKTPTSQTTPSTTTTTPTTTSKSASTSKPGSSAGTEPTSQKPPTTKSKSTPEDNATTTTTIPPTTTDAPKCEALILLVINAAIITLLV